jgi:hypothetical protein
MQKQRRIFIRQTNARQHQSEQSGRPSEHAHYLLRLSGAILLQHLAEGTGSDARQYTFDASILWLVECQRIE